MRPTIPISTALLVLASLFLIDPAAAQSRRTFVSGQGADTGACPVTAPCRSFAYAITQTIVRGDIAVLDSAGYGAVTINQAVNIVNDGNGEAAITASGQNAISIDLGGSGGTVTLRGLTLVGENATDGILFGATGGAQSAELRDQRVRERDRVHAHR